MNPFTRASASVLVGLTLVGWLLIEPSFERQDNRWLLSINGMPFDLIGSVREHWGRLTTDCSRVETHGADRNTVERFENLLRDYSPPDSRSARIAHILKQANWWLVEADFTTLPPAVVLVQGSEGSDQTLHIAAVWSGSTHPWRTGPFAGDFLRQRAPEAPAELTVCAQLRDR